MQLLVLRRVVVSARARGMPEITSRGKLFFSTKTIGNWSLTGVAVPVGKGMTPARFNRPGSNRTQIWAEDPTSGHGRCTPGSDDGARILRRPAPRWQCALKA